MLLKAMNKEIKSLQQAILTLTLLLASIAIQVQELRAQSDIIVTQCYFLPDSSPAIDLEVSFLSTTSYSGYIPSTDSNGCVSVTIPEGSYSVTAMGSTSYVYSSSSEVLADSSYIDYFDTSHSNYNAGSSQIELSNVTLSQATSVIEVRVIESESVSTYGRALGDGIPNLYVQLYDPDDPKISRYTTTDATGRTFFALDGLNSSSLNIWSSDQNGDFTDASTKISTSTLPASVTLEAVRNDSVVHVDLVDSNGNPFFVAAETNASIDCSQNSSPYLFFSKSLWRQANDPAISSGDIKVTSIINSGIYSCKVYVEGYGGSKANVTVSSGQTTNITLTVYEKNALVTFRVLDDATGELIPYPFGFSISTPYDETGTSSLEDWASKSSTTGTATMTAIDGVGYMPYFYPDTSNGPPGDLEYILPSDFELITASATQETIIDYRLTPTTASVQVNMVDAQGNPFDPSYQDYASVECRGTKEPYSYFSKYIDTYSSQVPTGGKIFLTAGSYVCKAQVSGYGTTEESVVVKDGDELVVNSRVLDRNSAVTIRVIDSQTGQLIPYPMEYSIYTEWNADGTKEVEDNSYDISSLGYATLPAVSNIPYAAQVYRSEFLESQSALSITADESFPYVFPNTYISFTTSPGETVEIDLPLDRAEAFLDIEYVDSDGNFVPGGWADVYCQAGTLLTPAEEKSLQTQSNDQEIFVGKAISNGQTSIALFANRDCEARVHPPYVANEEQAILPSKVQFFTLQDGERKTLRFVANKPNFFLNVISQIPEGLTPNFIACNAYNSNGEESYVQINPSSLEASYSVRMPLRLDDDQAPYSVGCYGIASSPSSEEKYLFGSLDWVPPEPGSTTEGELSLGVLSESGTYYPQETYSFSASEAANFTLADGRTTLNIPAKAFASSGNVLAVVKSGSGYTFNDSDYPTLSFDLSFSVDGSPVTVTQKPVTIRFGYDDEYLTSIGVSEDQLQAGSFREQSRTWVRDAKYNVDTTNNVVEVTGITHFSIWALLGKISSGLKQGRPNALKAKKGKQKKKGNASKSNSKKRAYTLGWTAPTSAKRPTYQVRILKLRGKKKKKKKRSSRIRADVRNTDYNFEKAKVRLTTETELKLKLKKGQKYVVDVSVVPDSNNPNGSIVSAPKKIRVK